MKPHMEISVPRRSLKTSIEHCSLLCLLLVFTFLPYTVDGACSADENSSMQKRYTDCTKEATTSYQSMLEKGGDKEEATCTLFETFINQCGETWTQCHSEEDIRKMKDMQIQALLGQYVDSGLVQLEDCPIVNQFWESEESYEGEGSGAGCSDKAYIKTQTKFQTCSHTVSTEVYQSFQGVEDQAVVTKAICQAIHNISITCPELLKTCFGPMDVKQMVKVHLKEIKSYLINLSNLQIPVDDLDNCTVPEFEGEVKDYEYYYEDYEDEVEDDVVQQNQDNEISDSIKKLLKDHKSEQPADQPANQPADLPKPTPTKAGETIVKSTTNKSYDQPSSSDNLRLHFVLSGVVIFSMSILH